MDKHKQNSGIESEMKTRQARTSSQCIENTYTRLHSRLLDIVENECF